ncbi:40263_t:CDS:2, partial [Gigaspora margarita]
EKDKENEFEIDLRNTFKAIKNQLRHDPINEWKVGDINITSRFQKYQIKILNKAKKKKAILPQEISSSLHEVSMNHFLGKDVFIDNDNSALSRKFAIPSKTTEMEHCNIYMYPLINPFFSGEREYKLSLDRANLGNERPDLSCMVQNIPVLNSEVKPVGCFKSQKRNNCIKAHLKWRKSVNQQINENGPGESSILLNLGDQMESYVMDLNYDGIYRSWSLLRTLIEPVICHVIALETC